MYFLGIDGGGTKTQFALCDELGHVLHSLRMQSFSLAQAGEEGVLTLLRGAVSRLLGEAGLSPLDAGQIDAVCWGVPGWGESGALEESMTRVARACFGGSMPMLLCNDAQVAWAGSFAMRPGINVVAGTGAIAFGMDARGNHARCGGWGFALSDEGSGLWLGRKLIELFCKQADGRIPERGPLYAAVRAHFGMEDDFEIVEQVEQAYYPYRDKMASLQMVLLEAARAGDRSAVGCYREAGREIALNALGVRSRLVFEGGVNVSYSGGIFQVGPLIFDSFSQTLSQAGCALVQPIAPPWIGALMLALSLTGKDTAAAVEALSRAHEAVSK